MTWSNGVTADEFRELALSFPESVENQHMGHPDFRVKGRVFATLGPDEQWAMVALTADQQALYVGTEPSVYQPANGAWGRKGATIVQLEPAHDASVGEALTRAWRNKAPKKLVQQSE